MAKSWADMSKEERNATGKTKKEYNRSTGQGKQGEIAAAKAKAQAQTTQSAQSAQPTQQAESKPAEKTYTAEVTGASLNNLKLKQEKEAKEQAKMQAKEKASAYLRDHPNAGKGSTRDAGFHEILKEGGLNNHQYQQMINADKKVKYENEKANREKEATAYQQYTTDFNNARKASGLSQERVVDDSQFYKYQMETTGSYGGRPEKQAAIEGLMGTGKRFTNLDVQREMGSASYNNHEGLYKQYGGMDNYFKNHSVGSGNFQEQEGIGTSKEADDKQRAFLNSRSDFFNNDSFNEKYGQYDFFQKDKDRFNQQSQKWNQHLDDREAKLTGTARGASMGY